MTVNQSQHHTVDWNQTSISFSPLEKLPNEIFGKILACLPALFSEAGPSDISAVVECKKQLEMTSKKIYLAVNSPCCAVLFMQAIWKKYIEPENNFTYSELAVVKKGIWDRVRGGSMYCSFEVTQRETWAPLEALPDEILRKIVTCLTEVRGGGSAQAITRRRCYIELQKKEMQKTIRSQINLGLASKRLYKLVHDGYTKRLFVHAVINRYQMLDFGLFVREVVAVRKGVRDYIQTHQLEKSSTLTTEVCRFLSSLIEFANQNLKEYEASCKYCLHDFLPLGFEIHSHPGSVTFIFSPNMMRIYCPFVTLAVWLDGKYSMPAKRFFRSPHSSHLIFLALVESLIAFSGATFLGIRARHIHSLNEFSSWPDSTYYEIRSPSPPTSLLRRISLEEMHPLTRSSAWGKRGSSNLIVGLNPNFCGVYQVHSLLGERIPRCRISGLHASPGLTRLINLVHLILEQGRPYVAMSNNCFSS